YSTHTHSEQSFVLKTHTHTHTHTKTHTHTHTHTHTRTHTHTHRIIRPDVVSSTIHTTQRSYYSVLHSFATHSDSHTHCTRLKQTPLFMTLSSTLQDSAPD